MLRCLPDAVLVVCLLGSGRLGAADPAMVTPRAGEPFAAALTGLAPQWELRFTTPSGERAMPARDVVGWGYWRDQAEQPICLAGQDSQLVATLMGVTDRELIVESRLWRRVNWPRDFLRGVILHPPLDPLERDRLCDRVLGYRQPQDRLWLANGDELTGRLLPTSDESGANLFGVQSLQFQLPGAAAAMTLGSTGVVALALGSAPDVPVSAAGTSAYLALRDGSCLLAQEAGENEGLVEVRLRDDLTLSADRGQFFAEITGVQPLGPDVLYLSNLEPVGYRHVPFLDLAWPLTRNRNLAGGLLRENARVHRFGLSLHSTARAVYDLPPDYREFAAELALDESAGAGGSVIYRVFLERAADAASPGGWQRAYESPLVRGNAAPLRARVALQGARRIALVVDFADRGDTLDRADWIDARLTK